MNRLPLTLAAVVLAAGTAAAAEPAQLASGTVTLTVEAGGSGFVDALAYRDRTVCRAPAGFAGATLALVAPAPAGDAAALFACAPSCVLTARVERAATAAGALTAAGRYTDGGALSVPFERRFAFDPDGALRFSETTDYAALPAGWRVAQHALHLPLVVTNDLHLRMFGLGCAGRAELFRMDMNDLSRRNQLISAPRGHWPYWDLAGVQQLPGSYRAWTANHADTPVYPLQEGPGAPGWVDYSEYDWGITARVDEPAHTAPWSAVIDARRGVLTLEPWPASQPAVAAAARGRRTFAAAWTLHDTSWPAAAPCELDFATYRALLADIGDYIHSAVGTSDTDTILFRERLQPSTAMRLLYRGDAWRMTGRLAAGIQVPRNQPMVRWEADAARYLAFVRTNGVPARVRR